MKKRFPVLLALVLAICSCELYSYGQLGGADKTGTFYPGSAAFESIMSSMSGVWYSHYAGAGRLDGYRIGKWSDFPVMVENPGKDALFPLLAPLVYNGSDPPFTFTASDYFVLYDDSVYGQAGDSGPPQASWGFAYIGIVRAINVFNGDTNRGAVIIQYLQGGAPQWDDGIKSGQRPFFGLFYRNLKRSTIQMANAVDLAALYAGETYYTETADLAGAIAKNSSENEAEFISWGVVIPQEREE